MLPIKRRVRKDRFPQIMKEGSFLHSSSFFVRFLPISVDLPTLFSFVVSSKVKRTAVGRHIIKRRMSVSVEDILSDIKPGFSVVVFAKNSADKLSLTEIKREIVDLLKKANILK